MANADHPFPPPQAAREAPGDVDFRQFLDTVPAMLWMADEAGAIVWFNRSWYAFTGRDAALELGRGWEKAVDPDDLAACRAAYAQTGPAGEAFRVQYRVRRAGGEYRWLKDSGLPRRNKDGHFLGFAGSRVDITDIRHADHELHQSAAALRRVTERLEAEVAERTRERDRIWTLSNELMSVMGTDGYLKSFNPAWQRTLGHDVETLRATPFTAFLHPDDREPVQAVLDRLARGETVRRYRSRMRCADGTYRILSWTVVPEGDYYYANGRDVTEERAIVDELAAANRQLTAQIEERERVEATLRQMQRLEAVGQFTSGVAHDFNNLLTVILGNIRFLERELPKTVTDARFLQRLGYMRSAAERGAKLTAQLLAFSRRQRLEPRRIDLTGTIADMRDLMQATIGGGIDIGTRLEGELWSIWADPTQLELAILNLAINARDAMEKGGVLTISTTNVTLGPGGRAEEPAPGDYVAVSVRDTGTGMAENIRERVFEPFFTTKEIGKGSGLGLSQVLGFAKQSGGGVRIDSETGKGTEVHLYFPRHEGEAEDEPVRPAPLSADGLSATPGARILLVDDEDPVRDVAATILREQGHDVVEAHNAQGALEILAADSAFALVLVDFAMPGMNGAELAERILGQWPGLKLLFVTGYGDTKALSAIGRDRVITKPFVDDELVRKVHAVLEKKKAQDSPSPKFST